MKITLINPNIVTQRGDFFGTGIPYMPIPLAYLASYLRNKCNIDVIDAFGENPLKKRTKDIFIIQGIEVKELINKIDSKTDLIFLYAGHVVQHIVIGEIIKEIKRKLNKKIVMVENAQDVTAYSLLRAKDEFFSLGADIIIYGDPEETALELIKNIENKKGLDNVKGLIYKKNNIIKTNKKRELKNLDELPFPAWDLFPIKNYWKLLYSHAPFKGSFLPILSSRGCPYNCQFCITPFINQGKWRARSAKNVFDEINYFVKKFGVREFHFEDLNPTVDKNRLEEFCRLIISNNLDIILKFPAGTKIDLIDKNTLRLLKKAGCDHIGLSPETGSKQLLKLMKKPFDYKHGISMVKEMNKLKIKSNAGFVLGFPGETDKDLRLTRSYIMKLTKAGLDEVSLYIMTPVPGSKPYESWQIRDFSKLTFSPTWRKGYKKLHNFRKKTYLTFFMYKLLYHPLKTLKQPINFIFKRFGTKMEMTLYRVLRIGTL